MNKETTETRLKPARRQANIIWYAVLLGLIVFLTTAWYMVSHTEYKAGFQDYQFLSYFSYLAVIIALPGGYFLFDRIAKKKLFGGKEPENLFRMAYIVKYAVFEFAGLFSTAVYMLSGKSESIYMSAIVITAFLINKPSINTFLKAFGDEPENIIEEMPYKPEGDKNSTDNEK